MVKHLVSWGLILISIGCVSAQGSFFGDFPSLPSGNDERDDPFAQRQFSSIFSQPSPTSQPTAPSSRPVTTTVRTTTASSAITTTRKQTRRRRTRRPRLNRNRRPNRRRQRTTRTPTTTVPPTPSPTTTPRPAPSSTPQPSSRQSFRQNFFGQNNAGQGNFDPNNARFSSQPIIPETSTALSMPFGPNFFRRSTESPQGREPQPTPGRSDFPSAEMIQEMRLEAQQFILADEEWIPNLVQMVFHTCVGGCDGCLNFAEKDNIGLRDTYRIIKDRWPTTRARVLSLADFIVLMATEAAQIGLVKSEEILTRFPFIEFTPGRVTCPDPDNYHLDHEFPHGDNTSSVEYLMDQFGYTDRRMPIALLGAHSLGGCKSNNSGFQGEWDKTPLTLDNHYYKSMVETQLWTAVPSNGSVQWNSTEENGPMMLHADLALIHDFQLDANHFPNCPRSFQCRRSKDSGRVQVYAASMGTWVKDFIPAFIQMVNKRPENNG